MRISLARLWVTPAPLSLPKHRNICSFAGCRYSRIMAESASTNTNKKLVRIDISSDTVCPWCFVGKKYLDEAISASKDQYDFELHWRPFQLDPGAPKEGIDKREYYIRRFGSSAEQKHAHMAEVLKSLGLEYNMSGLTGNTMDSHRLIYFAGQQGHQKQHNLVEQLFLGYFTQAKYIGDRPLDTSQGYVLWWIDLGRAVILMVSKASGWEFLLECANKAGIEGASEFLQNPNNGLKEVKDELNTYSGNISGVPLFVINGKHRLSGGQRPEVFSRAFQATTS